SSPAAMTPSTQGRIFFAQWSVCRMAGTPYTLAIVRTCSAPAIDPAIEACCWLLSSDLPPKNCDPVCDSWMMIGAFASFAAASAALAELDPITFTAASAQSTSLQYAKSSLRALPVMTPGESLRFAMADVGGQYSPNSVRRSRVG